MKQISIIGRLFALICIFSFLGCEQKTYLYGGQIKGKDYQPSVWTRGYYKTHLRYYTLPSFTREKFFLIIEARDTQNKVKVSKEIYNNAVIGENYIRE